MKQWMAPAAGTEAEAWETLTAALGVKGVSVGQHWSAPAGVPPLSGVVFQVGKGDKYRRCEFIDGTWRKTDTANPQQPAAGFTVSAELETATVDTLCKTWENTTEAGRKLTQMLAELSIKKTEGGSRRYVP